MVLFIEYVCVCVFVRTCIDMHFYSLMSVFLLIYTDEWLASVDLRI